MSIYKYFLISAYTNEFLMEENMKKGMFFLGFMMFFSEIYIFAAEEQGNKVKVNAEANIIEQAIKTAQDECNNAINAYKKYTSGFMNYKLGFEHCSKEAQKDKILADHETDPNEKIKLYEKCFIKGYSSNQTMGGILRNVCSNSENKGRIEMIGCQNIDKSMAATLNREMHTHCKYNLYKVEQGKPTEEIDKMIHFFKVR